MKDKKMVACFLTGGIGEEIVKVAKKYGLEVRWIPVYDKPENWNLDGCDILVIHTEFIPKDPEEVQKYLNKLSTPLPWLRLLTSWIPRFPPTFYNEFIPALMNIEVGGEKVFDEFHKTEGATAYYLEETLKELIKDGELAPIKQSEP